MRNLILLTLVLLHGCAQLPQQDVDVAKDLMDQARSAGAEQYAPEAFKQAEDTWRMAMLEVEAQKERFALGRSYAVAEKLLQQTRQAATRAKVEAGLNREQFRRTAEELIKEARIAIDAAHASLKTAPSGKGTQADLAAMKTELSALQAEVDRAQQAFDAGDYLAAQSKAESVKARSSGISGDIERARARKKTT